MGIVVAGGTMGLALPTEPLAAARALAARGVHRTFMDRGHEVPLVPPAYMKPIDLELQDALAMGERYPGLVRPEVIGRSVEGRPIVMLHMTNFADPRPKPLVGLETGIHGDEIANGSWGAVLANRIAQEYGTNPAATAVLDSREFRFIVFANPDGRARVQQGYLTGREEDLFFRTNANGVDLNRNFPFAHGATHARRGNAGTPNSEPETQAMTAHWLEYVPGAFLAGHSQGGALLVPFGHTAVPAKDHEGLMQIARGIAARNGYEVKTSAQFTRGGTSGTSKDWVYGELDRPGFTMEIGTRHHMGQAEFDDAVVRNRPAVSWFARIADSPYERAAGPGIPSAVQDARGGIEVLARPEGLRRAIADIEVYGDPLAPVGSGIGMRLAGPADAHGATRWVLDPRAVAALDDVRNGVIYVRAHDTAGTVGPFTAVMPQGAMPAPTRP